MAYGVLKALVGTLSICVTCSGVFSHAECSIDTIIVNGRVEHAPRKGIVKVQLIYPRIKSVNRATLSLKMSPFAFRFCFPHRVGLMHTS